MQLTLKSETVGKVVVVRCCGRFVAGEEAQFLQAEVQRLTHLTKNVVLQLAEVNYIDSGGLGVLDHPNIATIHGLEESGGTLTQSKGIAFHSSVTGISC